jgi:hypothetical protein
MAIGKPRWRGRCEYVCTLGSAQFSSVRKGEETYGVPVPLRVRKVFCLRRGGESSTYDASQLAGRARTMRTSTQDRQRNRLLGETCGRRVLQSRENARLFTAVANQGKAE